VSTALETIGHSGLDVIETSTFGGMDTLAKRMSESELVPLYLRGKTQNCFLFIMACNELDLGYVTGLTNLYIVDTQNGPQITASADYMIMRARMFGHIVRHKEEGTPGKDDHRFTTIIIRKDDPGYEHKYTYSLGEAKQAGLYDVGKKTSAWYKFTRAMLRHRADSMCVRMACGEVLGVAKYTPEELGKEVAEDGTPIITDARPSRAIPTPAQSLTVSSAEAAKIVTAAPVPPRTTPVKKTAAPATAPAAVKAPLSVKAAVTTPAPRTAAPAVKSAAATASPTAGSPKRAAQEIFASALKLVKDASREGKSGPEIKTELNKIKSEMARCGNEGETVTVPAFEPGGKEQKRPLRGALAILEKTLA
jgi:hypothetical protein